MTIWYRTLDIWLSLKFVYVKSETYTEFDKEVRVTCFSRTFRKLYNLVRSGKIME